jgi:anti-sigma factor RsiW
MIREVIHMTCQDFLQCMEDLLDSRNAPTLMRRDADEHLAKCSECRALYEQHLAVERQLRSLPKIPAPADLTGKVLRQVSVCVPIVIARPVAWWRMLGVAAALIILLGSPLYMLAQPSRPYVSCADPDARFEIVGNRVVVPLDVHIAGDLKVVNGHLTVLGTVEGQITLIRSALVAGPEASVRGVETVNWSWYESLIFGLTQMREDVRSFVRGAWR